jgi:hypothetical protein
VSPVFAEKQPAFFGTSIHSRGDHRYYVVQEPSPCGRKHEISLGQGLIQLPPAFGSIGEDHLEVASNTFRGYSFEAAQVDGEALIALNLAQQVFVGAEVGQAQVVMAGCSFGQKPQA